VESAQSNFFIGYDEVRPTRIQVNCPPGQTPPVRRPLSFATPVKFPPVKRSLLSDSALTFLSNRTSLKF